MDLVRSQRGFTLVQAMIAVAISAITAVGIAAAVSNGIDGLSHSRNFNLAEDLSLFVAGVMGDPNYCATHFAGKTISDPLPSIVDDKVVFKDITQGGTLGTNILLQAGSKYQNILLVESVQLQVDNMIGPQRYLGSIVVSLKGNTGYNLNFQRTIPLNISTNSAKKIVSCGRLSEPSHGTTVGVWSLTCDDFASKGWPSRDACIKDGRWHLVFQVTASGSVTRGSLDEMISLTNDGGTFRVQVQPGTLGFRAGYDLCSGLAVIGNDMACLVNARPGVPDWNTKHISAPGSVVYFSNGKLVYTAPNENVFIPIDWFVKF